MVSERRVRVRTTKVTKSVVVVLSTQIVNMAAIIVQTSRSKPTAGRNKPSFAISQIKPEPGSSRKPKASQKAAKEEKTVPVKLFPALNSKMPTTSRTTPP